MSHGKNRNIENTEQQWKPEPEEKKPEQLTISEVSIGKLLKNERERKGLSYVEISKTTCIRDNILKALEDEEWDKLPSSVFVKGFIRSYSCALGLDEAEAVRLYQKKVPPEAPLPKPLVEPARSKKPFYVLVVFLLLAMAAAYYLWKEYPTRKEIVTSPETITPAGSEIGKTKIPKEMPVANENPFSEIEGKTELIPQSDLKTNHEEDEQVRLEEEKEETDIMPQAVAKTTRAEAQDSPAEEQEENENIRSSVGKPPQINDEIIPTIEDLPLTLKAYVREKTWVKIFVDDEAPKEYIFKPGSLHEWTARKGFDLLIGNAGGIDLEFNGEKIENIGAPGQVVRLVFPQYYIERSPN